MQPVMTTCGPLIPQHTANDLRRKEIVPVSCHPDGTPRSVPLEEQTAIPTPVGLIPAELVTFHADGSLSRVFPLNGKLSGYWGQEDEEELATPLSIATPLGKITARILGLAFHATGTLRSVTLWPGDVLTIQTPTGPVQTRIGMSFYEDGSLHSVEPDKPVAVRTPVGTVQAIDPDAVGVNGDSNSLMFNPDGSIAGVTTTLCSLKATRKDRTETVFQPQYRDSLCGDSEKEVEPIRMEFGEYAIRIRPRPDDSFIALPWTEHQFKTAPFLPQLAGMGGLQVNTMCG